MADEQTLARARAAFDACFGGAIPFPQGPLEPDSYGALNMEMIAGTWGDERLSMRDKRLVVLSLLLGSGADPSLFELHAGSAMKMGDLAVDDIRALLNFALFYAGAPKATLPAQRFDAMVAALDKEGDA